MSLLLTIIMLLITTTAFSQSQAPGLPINDEGKIFYQEEIQVEGVSERVLWLNAVRYLERVNYAGKGKSPEIKLDRNSLNREGSFFVYTRGLFSPQIHGEIIFTIKVEVSEGRYTYSVSNLVFQFYQKNRYGQYAPVKGKYKPLEEVKYAGMQEIWEQHKALAREVVENHIRVLKMEMQTPAPVPQPVQLSLN